MPGQRVRAKESKAPAALALVVVVLLAAGGAALLFDTDPGSASSSDRGGRTPTAPCQPVTLSVPTSLTEPARSAVAALAPDAPCGELVLEVVDLTLGKAPTSDLWIAESGVFAQAVPAAQAIADSVASTPVLSTRRGLTSWAAGLRAGTTLTDDPATHPASALVLLTGVQEVGGADSREFREALARTAQGTADDSVRPADAVTVTTEQAARAGNLSASAPRTTPYLDFPLSRLDDSARVASVGQRLVAWFSSATGTEALAAAGLRGPDRAPLSPGDPSPGVATWAEPSGLEALAARWQRLHVPLNTLLVLDASGSMKERVNGVQRAQVVVDGLGTALADLPSATRAGLWSFAVNLAGTDRDWAQLVPDRALRTSVDGTTQRAVLGEQLSGYSGDLNGGTGLFDTTLAAYRHALENYRPGFENVILLVTDGTNDDTESVELAALVAELGTLRTDDRPVQIVGVQVAGAGDAGVVSTIAEATGGSAHQVNDAADLAGLPMKLLLARI